MPVPGPNMWGEAGQHMTTSCNGIEKLAEHFEVSRRAIGRYIDSLCRAEISICTRQGINGGISIMENYRLERTLLSGREMQEILEGLRGLDSVSGRDYIWIDLSSWYKGSLASKIERIQSAIEGRRLLEFRFYAPGLPSF